ncbi:hypothetical protein PG985_010862 [Apiospora marii]|uniref:uncharacterized protein n=1 Tax=Apiospora marii TaxID=335849 RepID=UPI003130E37F
MAYSSSFRFFKGCYGIPHSNSAQGPRRGRLVEGSVHATVGFGLPPPERLVIVANTPRQPPPATYDHTKVWRDKSAMALSSRGRDLAAFPYVYGAPGV